MMNEAIFKIFETAERKYEGPFSQVAGGAVRDLERQLRVYFDKELDGHIPARNFVATLAANVNNSKMDDVAFREFVRNTLPIVEGAPEDLGPSGVGE